MVAYLFHNWDWQADPGNGDYGSTTAGRLNTGRFEGNDQGYDAFKRAAERGPMIEQMVELAYVRPDNYIKEYRLGKMCKDKPYAAPSEVPCPAFGATLNNTVCAGKRCTIAHLGLFPLG